MILGFDTNLSRDEAVRRARLFLAIIGPEKEHTVDPHAQWKFGMIVKARCRESFLQAVVFASRKKIENGGGKGDIPKWATEERSPEVGKRARMVKGAVEQMKKAWPEIDVDGGGTLWIGAKEAARYDTDPETWKRKAAWNEFEGHWNLTWDQIIEQTTASSS